MARSLRERLQSLQQSVSSHPTVQSSEPATASLLTLGFRCESGFGGEYYVREIRYDVLTQHGKYAFQSIFDIDMIGIQMLINRAFSISDLRFYDTETTGLGTGAGTFAFLHTIGLFEDDEFCLYQYFVDDYSVERPILSAIESYHLHSSSILVTFNGKSFDLPMLQARRAMHRMEPLKIAGHIDLLHPSRKLWRSTLDRVSLVSVESHVLDLVRHDDLPGKDAPGRYFAYIDSKDGAVIEPVLQHNAIDVCSLVGILTYTAHLLSGKINPNTPFENTALAQYFSDWGQNDLAQKYYVAATESAEATWQMFWKKSLFFKRLRRFVEAQQVWKEMVNQFPLFIAPILELAKLAEHREKDYRQAEEWVKLAMKRYESRCLSARVQNLYIPYRVRTDIDKRASIDANDVFWQQLEHRLNRIMRKQNQA